MRELGITAQVEWLEAKDVEGTEEGPRTFSMLAYTGDKMTLGGWDKPVVVSLEGLRITAKPRPILRDHNASKVVGHTTSVKAEDGMLYVEGVISGAGPEADEVVAASKKGFPWQASIGAKALEYEFVKEGETTTVNGREVEGPFYMVKESVLGEVSFVALGADDNTYAKVAAEAAGIEVSMFSEWVQAQGFNLSELTDEQRASLQAAFDAEQKNLAASATESVKDEVTGDDHVAALRASMAAEASRVASINAACKDNLELAAEAIAAGWSAEKAELEALRAARPAATAPAAHTSTPEVTEDVLAAALSMSVGRDVRKVEAEFGERTMDIADKFRNIGLRELCAQTAKLEGKNVPAVFGDGTDVMNASFSTMSLPNILENVMNKTLLDSYEAQEITALRVCRTASVSDFKQVKRMRFLGTGRWEQVAPDGELQSAKVDEQAYTNQAETFGQTIALTRHDVINDDLSAFLEIPTEMGRQGAYVIDDIFFNLLLNGTSSFFTGGNGNLVTGAASAFDIESLGTAYETFRKQKAGPGSDAEDQRPINIRPSTILCPVELEIAVQQLMNSPILGADNEKGTANPFSGRYNVISSPLLSDSYYAGASSAAWYLMADPAALHAFELCFLNGRQTPTIERIDPLNTPNHLVGMHFRGYIDVGVALGDPRAIVKCNGVD